MDTFGGDPLQVGAPKATSAPAPSPDAGGGLTAVQRGMRKLQGGGTAQRLLHLLLTVGPIMLVFGFIVLDKPSSFAFDAKDFERLLRERLRAVFGFGSDVIPTTRRPRRTRKPKKKETTHAS